MDFEGWERILNWIKQHWYSKRALLVAIILAICLPLLVFYNIDRIDIIKLFTPRRILLIAILVCATIFAWFFSRKLPKNLPDKVGIVVAIKAENETVKIRLKNDFAKELTNIINRNQFLFWARVSTFRDTLILCFCPFEETRLAASTPPKKAATFHQSNPA